MPPTHTTSLSWLEALNVYRQKPVLVMLFLGFSAGLPYLLVFSTLSAWLRDEGLSRSAIGFFSWVGITYSIKFFWAPFIDRLPLPFLTVALGRRRAWLLFAQLQLILGIACMSFIDPVAHVYWLALVALFVAFASATQDIVIDAFRVELAGKELQGAMAATYNLGYRIALLFAGAGALYVADISSWQVAYWVMAGSVALGILTTLLVNEPEQSAQLSLLNQPKLLSRQWFYQSIVMPFVDFFERNGWFSLVLLLFIGVYRLSDITMGIMANPFYLDLGFSKSEIASVSKLFGFAMTILGAFLGGIFVMKYGVYRCLIFGAVTLALTNLLFAQLALAGPNIHWLMLTISGDNLCGGFANVSLIAYLSSLTNRAYTATQFALFSSLMTLPGKFLSGFSGLIVDAEGYVFFFVYAALMGIPAIFLALYVAKKCHYGDVQEN